MFEFVFLPVLATHSPVFLEIWLGRKSISEKKNGINANGRWFNDLTCLYATNPAPHKIADDVKLAVAEKHMIKVFPRLKNQR